MPLPLDLAPFEAFYPALLPVAPCTMTAHLSLPEERRWHARWRRAWRLNSTLRGASVAHHCSEAECAAWLPKPPPSDATVREYVSGRSFVRVAASDDSDRREFGHIVILQQAVARRKPRGQMPVWRTQLPSAKLRNLPLWPEAGLPYHPLTKKLYTTNMTI